MNSSEHLRRTAAACLALVLLAGPALSVAESSAEPLRAATARDIIELTGIGSQPAALGQKGFEEDVDIRSPNGALSATVIRKASVARNANDYTLLIYRTAELLKRPHADVILEWSSTSNRSAISSLQWLADNRTLAFLGEQPGELPQVYTVRVDTKEVVARTAERTVVNGYEIAVDDSWLVVDVDAAREVSPERLAQMRREGFVVTPTTYLGDLVAGDWSGLAPAWSEKGPREIVVMRKDAPTRRFAAPTEQIKRFPEISPDGHYALFRTRAQILAQRQQGVSDGAATVLDLATGETRAVSKTPWADTNPDEPKIKNAPQLTLEHDLNRPTRLVAQDARGRHRTVVFDPSTEIASLRLAQVEVVRGKLANGLEWVGGLYMPPDAKPGQRYPLVIQTHGFDPDYFAPLGATTAGYAAQLLAAQGIAVMQFDDSFAFLHALRQENLQSVHETALAGYEAVVAALDRRGLIDPARVGLQGWSATVQTLYYALQHGEVPFATAILSDGQTGGYLEKVAVQNVHPGYTDEGEKMYGAQPEGDGLARWAAKSPGFNMSKVRVPVRIEFARNRLAFFVWEAYARLLEMHTPVELYVFPEGDHTLVKPVEQLTSVTSTVDWFNFWLHSREDDSPAKAEQYARWRKMREEWADRRSATIIPTAPAPAAPR